MNETLTKSLKEKLSKLSDGDFVETSAKLLQEQLGINYVLVGKLKDDDKYKVETLAFIGDGELFPSLTYSLFETPCENVVQRNVCYYPNKIKSLFPNDKELFDLGVESYMGSPVIQNDEAMGLVALMDRKKMTGAEHLREVLLFYTDLLAKHWQGVTKQAAAG